jgi:enoyl-CoA hydratase
MRGRVAEVTLNRPPVNAIDDQLLAVFNAVLDQLQGRNDWSVLHIRSSQRVFAAGADIALMYTWSQTAAGQDAMASYVERFQGLFNRIEALPQISFAEIGGAALGGGFEMCLSCDLRMAANEAKIGLPEVGIGLIPGAGGTQRLTRLCGRGVAGRIIYGAEPVDGPTAERLGMVQWSVPRADLQAQARAAVDKLAAMSPAALQAAKQCVQAFGVAGVDGYAVERQVGKGIFASSETQALLKGFLDRSQKKA